MRTGNTLAELLVVLCIVGLALCLFLPRGDADVATYGLDIVIGVVAVMAVIGACISAGAFWRRPLLVAGATVLCTAGGAFVGWMVMMHSLWAVIGMGTVSAGYFVYLIIVSGKRAEQ